MKLSEIKAGETFKTGNLESICLEHREDGTTLCLLKDFCKYMRFDEKSGNYANSKIRKYLNTEFYEKLAEEVGAENIVKHTVDLTSDEGHKDYGTVTDKVSLLTCDLYRHYVNILDKYNPNRGWWLATPITVRWITGHWKCCLRIVHSDGILSFTDCDICGGVRPFYVLKSSISVSKGKIDLFVTATEIAERLSNAKFDDITDDSGYFVVREFEDGRERAVDVYKSTGYGTQKPYYTVYCSFEDEDHDFYYTEDLSIKGLYKTLKEIADVEVKI